VFALTMRHLGHETTNERKGTLYSTSIVYASDFPSCETRCYFSHALDLNEIVIILYLYAIIEASGMFWAKEPPDHSRLF
jgi:hypothetical protein